ncbi:perlucin-like isoform X2 [Mercenaria mercenaria]|uniref:perlucin-like isoform X2 n=1 Tax=Mercenaria mercenaria TaxID=6596 RepID=UPI00234E67B7|nr:perlucin-like isoform X2 [Mercenaria mercenaria]
MLSENEFRWFFENGHSEVIPHNGYTNFETGQPDNTGAFEHCIEIRYNGHNALWNDRNCDAARRTNRNCWMNFIVSWFI